MAGSKFDVRVSLAMSSLVVLLLAYGISKYVEAPMSRWFRALAKATESSISLKEPYGMRDDLDDGRSGARYRQLQTSL